MSKIQYISQELQNTFERFLLDNMNAEERINFINQLESDKKLRNQFETFKTMFRTVEEEALKEKLDIFHKDFNHLKKRKHFKFKQNHYLIAASVAIFILLGGYWLMNKKPVNEKLYATYFTPDPGLPTVMGSTNNYAFYEAMVDYKLANYKKAILKWEALKNQKPKNDTLNYFLGVSHLADNNFGEAEDYLNSVKSLKKSFFYKDANFYYGLIQLKNNNIEAAKKALLVDNSEVSKKLLKALE